LGDREASGGAREARLRRTAEAQGLRLERSWDDAADPARAGYQLVHPCTRAVVHGGGLDLDGVEAYLTGDREGEEI
jgi:hypothetical protein